MKITIDSVLRFDPEPLSEELIATIAQELWMFNPSDPDEQIALARKDGRTGELVLPRGYALRLREILAHNGIEIEWIDRRVKVGGIIPLPTDFVEPRSYQQRAVERMTASEQGIYEAATASGKTISAALVCSRLQQRTIIVVDKINLATQWRERFEQALGVTPTIIGDGSWEESDITIATRQSLWTRREELDGPDFGWWANWGMLIVDECHAISAPSVRELFQRFPAHYRFGITATPDRHNWIMAASRGIIGEIVCRTTEEELQEAGVLLKPRVVVYRTPFQYRSNPGMSANMAWVNLTKALKTDPSRNAMISKIMAQDIGQTMLVQTDHTSHAQVLMDLAHGAGWQSDRILLLTGKQGSKERDRIRLMAEEGNVLIVSTIGKEALDIPRLNRYMIAFPTRNQTATKQMLGRVKRVHDTKDDAPVVYDVFDHRVPRLINMFRERRAVYEAERLEISFKGDTPLLSPQAAKS